jgi:hypothetical protein
LRIVRRLTARDWSLLCEAVVCLGIARLMTLLLPFPVVARRLGVPFQEQPWEAPASPAARRVGWALAAAARRTYWRSRCLEQAIAAKMMLRRRGIASTMYLGLTPRPVHAHAWVRVGDVNVTGGSDVERYAVVATFADAGRG